MVLFVPLAVLGLILLIEPMILPWALGVGVAILAILFFWNMLKSM